MKLLAVVFLTIFSLSLRASGGPTPKHPFQSPSQSMTQFEGATPTLFIPPNIPMHTQQGIKTTERSNKSSVIGHKNSASESNKNSTPPSETEEQRTHAATYAVYVHYGKSLNAHQIQTLEQLQAIAQKTKAAQDTSTEQKQNPTLHQYGSPSTTSQQSSQSVIDDTDDCCSSCCWPSSTKVKKLKKY